MTCATEVASQVSRVKQKFGSPPHCPLWRQSLLYSMVVGWCRHCLSFLIWVVSDSYGGLPIDDGDSGCFPCSSIGIGLSVRLACFFRPQCLLSFRLGFTLHSTGDGEYFNRGASSSLFLPYLMTEISNKKGEYRVIQKSKSMNTAFFIYVRH